MEIDNAEAPLISAEIVAAIKKSTDLSRKLYALQPRTITLPTAAGSQDETSEIADGKRLRLTLASALFSIALDHHVALVLLFQNNMRSSAFALLRAVFDAVWRGAWAAYVASHSDLLRFSTGRYDPSPDRAIQQLEKQNALPPVLSKIKGQGWSTMSAYVHSGLLQIQRWVGEGTIEPQHSDAELLEVLGVADRLAFTACLFFVDVAEIEREELLTIAETHFT